MFNDEWCPDWLYTNQAPPGHLRELLNEEARKHTRTQTIYAKHRANAVRELILINMEPGREYPRSKLVSTISGISHQTTAAILEQLVEDGHVTRTVNGRGYGIYRLNA